MRRNGSKLTAVVRRRIEAVERVPYSMVAALFRDLRDIGARADRADALERRLKASGARHAAGVTARAT